MRPIAALTLAAALIPAPAPAAAATLVVRSSGPSAKALPPGRTLPDGAPLALKAGDVVTVLVASGTRMLRGPGSFTLSAPSRAFPAAAFNPRARFGAMRSGEIAASPSLWDVDVSQSGTVCLADPAKITLWRPESGEAATLSVNGSPVAWPAGKAILAWPGRVAVAEGTDYSLSLGGSGDVTHLRFKRLATVPQDLPGLAKAFIDNGCQTQLDLLVDTTPAQKP